MSVLEAFRTTEITRPYWVYAVVTRQQPAKEVEPVFTPSTVPLQRYLPVTKVLVL